MAQLEELDGPDSTRAFIVRISRTCVASNPAAGYLRGSISAAKASHRPRSPAIGRARSNAWNSQVRAHRS